MSDKQKERNPNKTHGLVFFKPTVQEEVGEKELYPFEKVDQENKIKLEYSFKPFGEHYLYSILLINQSLAPITEVKIKVKFPEFLTLKRCTPPLINIPTTVEEKGKKQINIEYDEFNENSKRQLNLHFAPLSVKKFGEIRTFVTFVNNKDYVRVLNSEPVEINVAKVEITPKIIPSFQITKILQVPGIKKAMKSFGISTNLEVDLSFYFNIVEQMFRSYDFQLIAKDPNKNIIWYFGTDIETQKDILVIGQLVSNKVEIIASSQNHDLIISLLTQITNDFKDRILRRGIVNSIDDIHELECKYCGAILPYFPDKGESIECQNCKYEQVLW
jgi:hypothetical protein